jgi:hypothetical protein
MKTGGRNKDNPGLLQFGGEKKPIAIGLDKYTLCSSLEKTMFIPVYQTLFKSKYTKYFNID